MLNDTITIGEEDAVTPIQRKKLPSIKSQSSVTSKRSNLSESIIKQMQSNQAEELKIDNRPHQFTTKKVFKSLKCGVCTNQITFCTSCYHCSDCRAICHMNCKNQVPLPCIPYVSRANIGKQGKLILISDYVQANCKPCVPALIVHCTSEIEKRGLRQPDIYRANGSEKEVKTLKEKILKAKQGIPQLAEIDVYLLCNVVKNFLCELDEPLVSRIMWRDFVSVGNIENADERQSRFKNEILSLPNANRDTLAFLALHLRRVSKQQHANQMTISILAKVFGRLVLGYSIKDPPTMQIFEENRKQQRIVEYLLSLDDEFWQSILDLDNNQLNLSILNPGDMSLHLSPDHQPNKGRPSIGSRLCGGTINSGTLTPLKNKKKKLIKSTKFMPLF